MKFLKDKFNNGKNTCKGKHKTYWGRKVRGGYRGLEDSLKKLSAHSKIMYKFKTFPIRFLLYIFPTWQINYSRAYIKKYIYETC